MTGLDLKTRRSRHWTNLLGRDVLSLERTRECFHNIERDSLLGYDLPDQSKSSMLPGQILKHCYAAVDKIVAAQQPCIFKVGFTHDASFRFYNLKFGYKYDRDKWEKMIVIYAASESISPGYVEAAIIQRHKGLSNAPMSSHAWILFSYIHDWST